MGPIPMGRPKTTMEIGRYAVYCEDILVSLKIRIANSYVFFAMWCSYSADDMASSYFDRPGRLSLERTGEGPSEWIGTYSVARLSRLSVSVKKCEDWGWHGGNNGPLALRSVFPSIRFPGTGPRPVRHSDEIRATRKCRSCHRRGAAQPVTLRMVAGTMRLLSSVGA